MNCTWIIKQFFSAFRCFSSVVIPRLFETEAVLNEFESVLARREYHLPLIKFVHTVYKHIRGGIKFVLSNNFALCCSVDNRFDVGHTLKSD